MEEVIGTKLPFFFDTDDCPADGVSDASRTRPTEPPLTSLPSRGPGSDLPVLLEFTAPIRVSQSGQKGKDFSMTGYCMKCRESQTIQDPQQVTLKNGRPATRGKCGDCGTTIFRIGAAS